MPATIRIDDILFDGTTGEVFRTQDGATHLLGRLAPQPTELLSLLVKHHPEITSHETIQKTLWPGSPGVYEKNMHFCVRKIRATLGDPATQSKYIETIPRRGYRLVEGLDVAELNPDSRKNQHDVNKLQTTDEPGNATKEAVLPLETSMQAAPSIATRQPGRHRKAILLGTCLLTAACLVLGLVSFRSQPATRIAIMTFESSDNSRSTQNDIAELLVERLSNHGDLKIQVIGPTTTHAFNGQPQALSSLIQTHSIDYMINGRFLDENHDLLLAEVIRASDAVHVWVARIDWRKDPVQAANRVADGFLLAAFGEEHAKHDASAPAEPAVASR